jgi:2-dehydro-3-deoxyphosphogluconate aldolase/(4S)-4-hydroxy-2-oxoglutarate aldolase
VSPIAAILRQRVLGIVRATDADAAREAGEALLAAGLEAVEVSLTTPDALGAIAALADAGRMVGAGAVLDADAARAALSAGAGFLVSPVLAEDVVETGRRAGAAVVAAAATPTEALRALERGADLVKLFPARTWSPAAVADLLQALPQLPLVPTGGIAPETARDWIAAGAVAVGIGSALTPERVPALLEAVSA